MIKVSRGTGGKYFIDPQFPGVNLPSTEIAAADLMTSIGSAMTLLAARGIGKQVKGVGIQIGPDEWELDDACLQSQP